MYRKFLILVVITFGFGVMAIAQTISGSVTDQDGNPLSFSSVYVEEIQKGTSVDFEGKYEITPKNRQAFGLRRVKTPCLIHSMSLLINII